MACETHVLKIENDLALGDRKFSKLRNRMKAFNMVLNKVAKEYEIDV
jgi:hypothetical protein